ncbi:hypothetical protein [Marinifilum flexuosum]|uniref:hypothetical protein n=1 Tax=Marinifilum flexuosum TaxID=1117708 RepID=UPI002493DC54|nr:hypothetical protein [Marinifilum flexuosum]
MTKEIMYLMSCLEYQTGQIRGEQPENYDANSNYKQLVHRAILELGGNKVLFQKHKLVTNDGIFFNDPDNNDTNSYGNNKIIDLVDAINLMRSEKLKHTEKGNLPLVSCLLRTPHGAEIGPSGVLIYDIDSSKLINGLDSPSPKEIEDILIDIENCLFGEFQNDMLFCHRSASGLGFHVFFKSPFSIEEIVKNENPKILHSSQWDAIDKRMKSCISETLYTKQGIEVEADITNKFFDKAQRSLTQRAFLNHVDKGIIYSESCTISFSQKDATYINKAAIIEEVKVSYNLIDKIDVDFNEMYRHCIANKVNPLDKSEDDGSTYDVVWKFANFLYSTGLQLQNALTIFEEFIKLWEKQSEAPDAKRRASKMLNKYKGCLNTAYECKRTASHFYIRKLKERLNFDFYAPYEQKFDVDKSQKAKLEVIKNFARKPDKVVKLSTKFIGDNMETTIKKLQEEGKRNIVITATTGAGKTTALCEWLGRLSNKANKKETNGKVEGLVNRKKYSVAEFRTSVVKQVWEAYNRESKLRNPDLPQMEYMFGGNIYGLREDDGKLVGYDRQSPIMPEFMVSTIDAYLKYPEDADILVVDEIDMVDLDANFRDVCKSLYLNLKKRALNPKLVTIVGTATPDMLYYLDDFYHVHFECDPGENPCEYYYELIRSDSEHHKQTIDSLLCNPIADYTVLYRNKKDFLNEIDKLYEDVTIFHADRDHNDSDMKALMEHGEIPNKIAMTSYLKAGNNFNSVGTYHFIIDGSLFNIDEIKQIAGRARKATRVQVSILCPWGKTIENLTKPIFTEFSYKNKVASISKIILQEDRIDFQHEEGYIIRNNGRVAVNGLKVVGDLRKGNERMFRHDLHLFKKALEIQLGWKESELKSSTLKGSGVKAKEWAKHHNKVLKLRRDKKAYFKENWFEIYRDSTQWAMYEDQTSELKQILDDFNLHFKDDKEMVNFLIKLKPKDRRLLLIIERAKSADHEKKLFAKLMSTFDGVWRKKSDYNKLIDHVIKEMGTFYTKDLRANDIIKFFANTTESKVSQKMINSGKVNKALALKSKVYSITVKSSEDLVKQNEFYKTYYKHKNDMAERTKTIPGKSHSLEKTTINSTQIKEFTQAAIQA